MINYSILFGNQFYILQTSNRQQLQITSYILLLLVYNYTQIIINSKPTLGSLVQLHGFLQARHTVIGLHGFPPLCTRSCFIPKPFHTVLYILYNVNIFDDAKVQIKICKLNHFACVSLISLLLHTYYFYLHIIIHR